MPLDRGERRQFRSSFPGASDRFDRRRASPITPPSWLTAMFWCSTEAARQDHILDRRDGRGEIGCRVKDDPGLLDEVAGLVECPVVMLGGSSHGSWLCRPKC